MDAGPLREGSAGYHPVLAEVAAEQTSIALLRRLWREEVRHYRGRLVAIGLLTATMAGLTGLYPFVISRALDMFAAHDPRILYQVPALVVMITAAKAAAQYGQTVAVQDLVLVVIRDLQGIECSAT